MNKEIEIYKSHSSVFFVDIVYAIDYYIGKDFVEKEYFMEDVFFSMLHRVFIHPFDAMIDDSKDRYSKWFFKKETENNINIELEINGDYEDLPF